MDPRTIYEKTAKGIGEIKNKTNHLPGKVRRLLIMVDGQASAAEIANKISNLSESKRIEAFEKLLEEGFIRDSGMVSDGGGEAADDPMLSATMVERLVGSDAGDEEADEDNADVDTHRARSEDERRRWDAADRARVEAEERLKAQRDLERQDADAAARKAAEEKSRWEREQREKLEAQMRSEAALAEQREAERRTKEEVTPAQQERERQEAEEKKRKRNEQVAKAEEERQRVVAELLGKAKAGEETKARAEAEARRRAESDADAKGVASAKAEKEAKIRQKLYERQTRKPLPKFMLPAIGGGAVALVVLVAVLMSFIPFNGDKPAMEKLMGDRINAKVVIGAVHAGLLPLPHLTLNDVAIGDTGEVVIDAVTVPWAMFGADNPRKAYKQVELEGVSIKQAALPRLLDWSNPPADGAQLSIDTLVMRTIRLTLNDVVLDKFDGQVNFTPDGNFIKANFTSPEVDRLKAEAAMRDGVLAISFSAKKWRAPLADALVFGELKFTGVARPGRFEASQIDAVVADGTAKGSGRIEWGDRWKLSANLELAGIDLDGITERFTKQIALTGHIDTKLTINAQSASMATLFSAPRVEGDFALANGALGNVDLMKAIIEAPNYDKVRGGQTVFKKFNGSAVLADGRLTLKQLSMVSGSLLAAGAVDVMPDGALAGKINLGLGSADSNPVKDTVAIVGSVKEPVLKPSK